MSDLWKGERTNPKVLCVVFTLLNAIATDDTDFTCVGVRLPLEKIGLLEEFGFMKL
jgi:hypothetical protein